MQVYVSYIRIRLNIFQTRDINVTKIKSKCSQDTKVASYCNWNQN